MRQHRITAACQRQKSNTADVIVSFAQSAHAVRARGLRRHAAQQLRLNFDADDEAILMHYCEMTTDTHRSPDAREEL